MMKKAKILVTGAAGFIGSNFIKKLLEKGGTVVGLDNFDDFYDPKIKEKNIASFMNHPQFLMVRGDIRDDLVLGKVFSENQFESVVHLAARAGVRPSIQYPKIYEEVNVKGTLNLLELMNRMGVKKFIFASSSSVYGNNKKIPFSETDNVDFPISPYAATKKSGELLCHTFYHLYAIQTFCLRFFTVYGPSQRPEMAIHSFTRAIDRGQPVRIFGDGSSARDYTYIDDIVTGMMNALERVNGFEIINLGNSRTTKLIDLVRLIEKHSGKKARLEYAPAQPGDVEITYADIHRAGKLLDFSPKTLTEEGIGKFVQWYKKEYS